jgi:hypothetical protein
LKGSTFSGSTVLQPLATGQRSLTISCWIQKRVDLMFDVKPLNDEPLNL